MEAGLDLEQEGYPGSGFQPGLFSDPRVCWDLLPHPLELHLPEKKRSTQLLSRGCGLPRGEGAIWPSVSLLP